LKDQEIKFLAFPAFLKPAGREVLEINSNFSKISPSSIQQGFAPLVSRGNQYVTIGGNCLSYFTGSSSCDSLVFFSKNQGQRTFLELKSATGLDQHDLFVENANSFWGIRYSLNPCKDNQEMCGGENTPRTVTNFADCEIINFARSGEVVTSWSAAKYLSANEILWDYWKDDIYQNEYADPFHCNSIDVNKTNKRVLISMRHTNSIYSLNMKTKSIDWKIGGNLDSGSSLKPKYLNSSISFGGQHDARWVSMNSITLLDNGTNTERAARGLIVSVEKTKYRVLGRFEDPTNAKSQCTGSFRRFNLKSGSFFIAGWGCSANGATIFNSRGTPIVSIALDPLANRQYYQFVSGPLEALNSVLSYRVYPIPIKD
jgi:hypothetical protein